MAVFDYVIDDARLVFTVVQQRVKGIIIWMFVQVPLLWKSLFPVSPSGNMQSIHKTDETVQYKFMEFKFLLASNEWQVTLSPAYSEPQKT